MITLRNEANEEVRKAHASKEGSKHLKGRDVLPPENAADDVKRYELDSHGNILSGTVQDELDLDIEMADALPRERRTRKAVERFVIEPGPTKEELKEQDEMSKKGKRLISRTDEDNFEE